MLNTRTLRAVREADNVAKSSEGVQRLHWKANKSEALIGSIEYLRSCADMGKFYAMENDRDFNSLQARYMKGMRPGGVWR